MFVFVFLFVLFSWALLILACKLADNTYNYGEWVFSIVAGSGIYLAYKVLCALSTQITLFGVTYGS